MSGDDKGERPPGGRGSQALLAIVGLLLIGIASASLLESDDLASSAGSAPGTVVLILLGVVLIVLAAFFERGASGRIGVPGGGFIVFGRNGDRRDPEGRTAAESGAETEDADDD